MLPPSASVSSNLGRANTTSVNALHDAFNAMQMDASQLPVEDLIQASTMLRELHGVLQEKLQKKLRSEENA
jgi:hypothetical protein